MYLRTGAVTLWVLAAGMLFATVHVHGWQRGNAMAWPAVVLLIGRLAWIKSNKQ